MKIKRAFSKEQELEFLKEEQDFNPKYVRWFYTLFIALYGFFAIADRTYYPDDWKTLFIIRFAIVIPILFTVFILTFSKSLSRFHQYYISFSVFAGGVGIAFMLILHPENIVYYGGLFMVYFSGHLLLKLRFFYATISGLAILLFQIIGHLIINNEMSEIFIYGTLFYLGANLIGMTGAYQFEVKNRKHFLYERELSQKNDELQKHFKDKTDRIKELEESIRENKDLTEKNKELYLLTQSLKESEERFKILHNASFGGIAVHEKGIILECNQGLSDITGYSINELIGMDGLLLIAPGYRDLVMSKILAGYELPYEAYGIRLNGEIYPLKLEARNIPFEGKQVRVVEFRDITELKQKEVEKNQTEEKYRLLYDTMIHGVVYQDNQGYITSCNPAAERILGLTLEQMQGKTSMDQRWKMIDESKNTVTGENHPAMLALKTKKVIGPVVRGVYRPDLDDYVWLRIIATPLFLEDQEEPNQVYATFEEITELKETQDNLKMTLEQHELVLNSTSSGIYAIDLNDICTYVNENTLRLLGYADKNEMLNKNIHKLVHHSYADGSRYLEKDCFLLRVSTSNQIVNQEDIIWRKDGTFFPVSYSSTPQIQDGNIIGSVVTFYDITERKKLEMERLQKEQELKESEEQFRLLTNEMQLGLALHKMIFDNEGNPIDYRFISVNKSFEQITGFKRENLIGKTVLEVLPNTEDYWIKEYGKVVRNKKSIQFENYSQDIGKYYRVSAYSPKEGFFATVIDDITERVQYEESLKYTLRHDSLTNLPNRIFYDERIIELDQKKNYPLAIVMMDINGLKLINDSLGQDVGNIVLKQFAEIILTQKQNDVFVARVSGDEFIMLCPNSSLDYLLQFKQRLLDIISKQRVENIEYSIAIGFAIKTNEKQKITDIMIEAENAMYKNKIVYGQSKRSTAIESVFAIFTNKYAYEKTHSERVARYSRAIGEKLGLRDDELTELELAGRLHDIGKIAIDDNILMKPGKLNNEEWEKIKQHTVIGYQILRAADKYSNLAEYAMSHHERMDGLGYPNGIDGKDIPLFSRIISVADAYEAMTSNRTYRVALNKEEAIKELVKHSNTQFDALIVDVFINKILPNEINEEWDR